MNLDQHPCFVELKRTGRLPSPQGVALKLLELSQDESVSNAEVVNLLKTDPVLCGRLIKIANGASFAAVRPIASVPDALVILGFNAVRQLTLGLSLVSSYGQGGCARFDYREFWARSLNAAIGTQLVGGALSIAPREELFVCGLLSRIGYLGLATVYPAQYSDAIAEHAAQPHQSLAEIEQKCFGIDHNELTRELMLEWRIPRQLVEPVARHEFPDEPDFAEGSRARRIKDAVQLAHCIATVALGQESARQGVLPDLFERGARMGLESDTMLNITEDVSRQAEGWSSLLVDRRAPGPVPAQGKDMQPAATALGVLIVCEDTHAAASYRSLFGAQGYYVMTAADNQAGLRSTFENQPNVVVVAMPQRHAMNFCRALRATDLGRYPYVIVLAGGEDAQHELEAFEAGADAWIAHPVDPKSIVAQLHAAKRVLGLQDDLRSGQQELRRLAANLASQNRRLLRPTTTDALTGLPNRHFVRERLAREWESARRSLSPLSCVWLEVEGLGEISAKYGNASGDEALKQIGRVLQGSIPKHHLVCYLEDAHFLVICPGSQADAAYELAQRLCRAVADTRYTVQQIEVRATAGAGIAAASPDIADWSTLMQYARRALHFAAKLHDDRCAIHPLSLNAG